MRWYVYMSKLSMGRWRGPLRGSQSLPHLIMMLSWLLIYREYHRSHVNPLPRKYLGWSLERNTEDEMAPPKCPIPIWIATDFQNNDESRPCAGGGNTINILPMPIKNVELDIYTMQQSGILGTDLSCKLAQDYFPAMQWHPGNHYKLLWCRGTSRSTWLLEVRLWYW